MAELFQCQHHLSCRIGGETSLLHFPKRDNPLALPTTVAEIILRCNTFRSLPEHTRQLRSEFQLNEAQTDAVRSSLEELAREGLLVSEREIIEIFQKQTLTEIPPSLESVGVVTKDRIAVTERALRSYAANARRHGRSPTFYILDDSTNPESRPHYQAVLANLHKELGVDFRYGGLAQKKSFANHLRKETGILSETIDFALYGHEATPWRYGANVNSLLLESAGQCVLKIDDDTICDLRNLATRPGTALSSSHAEIQLKLFTEIEEAANDSPPIDKDFLGTHERFLGSSVQSLFQREKNVRLTQAGPDLVYDLQTSRTNILATFSSFYGDSASASPSYYLGLRGEEREKMVSDEGRYQKIRTNRAVWKGVNQTTIAKGDYFQSGAMGLDNREGLVPFLPVLRGADACFGHALKACFEKGFVAYLPLSIFHSPHPKRQDSPEAVWKGDERIAFQDLLIACFRTFTSKVGRKAPAQRIHDLGKHLIEIGSLSTTEMGELVRPILWNRAAVAYQYLEESLQLAKAQPSYWANDIRRYLETSRSSLLKSDYFISRELVAGRTLEEAANLSQSLIRQFGALLVAWPALVAGAKTLRAREIRITTDVY